LDYKSQLKQFFRREAAYECFKISFLPYYHRYAAVTNMERFKAIKGW